MLAHRLRHRVTIQQQVETQSSTTGAYSVAWVEVFANVPAEVLTGAGREMIEGDARQGELSARINMRWFSGLTQKMRVVWQNVPYNITSIETDVTGRREYRLKCVAGLNDGQ